MKRKYRVTNNLEFQKIIKRKIQLVSNMLIIYFQNNDTHLRIGLSVSKRFGNAVIRNRVKRQTKAIINDLDILNKKFNVILITRQNFVKASYNIKYKAIKKIFERLQ